LDELKSYGFNSSSNYQDIVVFLLKKKANALREINKLYFHLMQMQISHDNPFDTLKVKFSLFFIFILYKKYKFIFSSELAR
jgi:hypothetical protein